MGQKDQPHAALPKLPLNSILTETGARLKGSETRVVRADTDVVSQ
jgi:hypothetical protein